MLRHDLPGKPRGSLRGGKKLKFGVSAPTEPTIKLCRSQKVGRVRLQGNAA